MKVRTNLKILRDTAGISLRDLQEMTGISYSQIHKMEHGKAVPTDQEVIRLCAALSCTYDMLYPDPELRRVLAE
jgi:transcriptional regulator with XRE-family HTH domain